MRYRSLTRTTPPAVEPVTLSEAKAHCRVDTSDDDAYISTLITAARQWVEEYLDRSLVNTQWTMRLDAFPYEIELPRPPIASSGTVTAVTLTYTLGDDSTATLSTSAYRVDRQSTPGVVRQLRNGTWPANLDDYNAVQVTWWGGYGATGSTVPAAIRHAMLMLCSHWYETRGATLSTGAVPQDVPFGVLALLDSVKWGSYR